MGPFPSDRPHRERSGSFLHLNTSKRGVTLDLLSPIGREVFKDLVTKSDGIIEGFRPGAMEDWGLGYQSLTSIREHLVMASITPFGQTGPYRDYGSSEIVLQAIAGPEMHNSGTADREPRMAPNYDAQYFAGLYAASGLLAALLEQKLEGKGQYLDISMAEAWAAHPLQGALFPHTGQRTTRPPAQARSTYLNGAYPCRDGFVGVQGSGRGETWWPRVFEMMGMPHLEADPRFSTPQGRAEHRDELDGFWYGWAADHTKEEIFAAARGARFPLAPVYDAEDVLSDPHFRERGVFVKVDRPEAGGVRQRHGTVDAPWALPPFESWCMVGVCHAPT